MFGVNCGTESICERLKHRFDSYRDDWQMFAKNDTNEKNSRDFQFIQYIVNFIIEQAKHNIVISELPEIIRTLHHETEIILQKNRMVTLQQVITQVQMIGARKYPYLKKVKPITVQDFVREVLREVFDRLGTLITLDMIEHICQLATCSAQQILRTIPTVDVSDAATLIIEDISRNQLYKKSKPLLFSDLETTEPKRKERMRSERDLLNSKQSVRSTAFLSPGREENMSEQRSMGKIRNQKNQNASITNAYPSSKKSFVCRSKEPPLIKQSGPSIRYYSKHTYQYSDNSDNDEQMSEIDPEPCPLEDILNHRISFL